MNAQVRFLFIDILKGIAILLIVYGHLIPGLLPCFAEYVSTFNIPVFFFVSGLLYNNDKYKNKFNIFLKGRLKGLIVPYIFLSIIVLFGYFYVEEPFLNFVNHCVFYGWGGYALWFIPVLFLVELLYYIISKLELKWIIISIVFSVLFSYVSSRMFGYVNYNILLVFCGVFYYGIGNISRRLITFWSTMRFSQMVLLSLLGLSLSLPYVYSNNSIMPEWFINSIPSLLNYFTPLGAILMLIQISLFIEKQGRCFLVEILSICGKYSLIILAFHQIVCVLFQSFLPSKIAILSTAIVLIVLVISIPRYFPWLIGKNK